MNRKRVIATFLISLTALLQLPIIYAASTNYYVKTTVYVDLAKDASFTAALPGTYDTTNATATTTEGTAAATAWISFNVTAVGNQYEPSVNGVNVAQYYQNGTLRPTWYIDNTGNCNETFDIKLSACAAGACPVAGWDIGFNASCSGSGAIDCGTVQTALKNLTSTSYTSLSSGIGVNSSLFLNVSLYAWVNSTAASGANSFTMYIRSTAV